MKQEYKDMAIIAGVIIALIIVYKMFKGIGDGLGHVGDIFGAGTEAKNVDKQIAKRDATPRNKDPWSPEYSLTRIANGDKIALLKGATKASMIKAIGETGGFWRIFPETGAPLLEMFKTIAHKSQVSDLAYAFQQKTGKDLLTYIKDQLQNVGWLSQSARNENLNGIINYVNQLPE
jgi:hypothetical protein